MPIRRAWSDGDPNILTYDNLTYTFNGNGEMIVSRANDLSFHVLAHTKIIRSISDSSLGGTVFSGFVVKTNVYGKASPLIQVELDDQDPLALDLSEFFVFIYFIELNLNFKQK